MINYVELKEQVNKSSFRQMSFEKFKQLKFASKFIQQLTSNQFDPAIKILLKTSLEAVKFFLRANIKPQSLLQPPNLNKIRLILETENNSSRNCWFF